MYEQLAIHYEGQTEFVATDQQRKPLRLFVTCPAGLEAGADVRVSISTFHSYSRKWTLGSWSWTATMVRELFFNQRRSGHGRRLVRHLLDKIGESAPGIEVGTRLRGGHFRDTVEQGVVTDHSSMSLQEPT